MAQYIEIKSFKLEDFSDYQPIKSILFRLWVENFDPFGKKLAD